MKEGLPLTEKEAAWQAKLLEIESRTDLEGLGLDEGVKETVAAFNLLGIPTSQSCEGHANQKESHSMWPWVSFGLPDEPKERYVGEYAALENMATERGMDVDTLKRSVSLDEQWEVVRHLQDHETTEYIEWEKKRDVLTKSVQDLLAAFYAEHEFDPERSFLIAKMSEGPKMESIEDEDIHFKFMNDELSEEETETLHKKLPGRQQELKDLTEFLKKRYFEIAQ